MDLFTRSQVPQSGRAERRIDWLDVALLGADAPGDGNGPFGFAGLEVGHRTGSAENLASEVEGVLRHHPRSG